MCRETYYQCAPVGDVAGKLYTAYCNAVGGVNFQGDPLPTWNEFSNDPTKRKQAEGWIAVAKEAANLSD